ncbi:hypothetical protein K503DRAFT_581452 [Rhizopogon vinicolor AM-OR11-026]|uniref:Uncharacterized protein n=1 Tax=Rhizopogon vinicolor AM-OR11-026 TaxID=1314800 RepID=A0A1B7NH26_9AGAM|nr:hypothetical protein K503DRAFT_581452 [Rhizopogon vinicolor AM-OR11-026]
MVFAQRTSQRKRPMCHRCWSTMAGHTRKNKMIICPTPSSRSAENSLPLSSPDSPPPTYDSSEYHGFQVPSGDRWHWRNPNWVSPPREEPQEDTLRNASLAPTEPLSEPEKENFPLAVEGSSATNSPTNEWADHADALNHYPDFSIKREEETPEADIYTGYSGSPSPRAWSSFSQSPITDISLNTALRGGTPLYSVYRVPRQDVPKVQRTAQREGKLFSVMNAPPAHLAKIPREKSRETVWVILSDREEDLRYAVHSQRMPGALAQDSSDGFDDPRGDAVAPVMQNTPFGNGVNHSAPQHILRTVTFDRSMDSMPGGLVGYGQLQSSGHGFLQMAFAGIIGGLIVNYGRALL